MPRELLDFYRDLRAIQDKYYEECRQALKSSGNTRRAGAESLPGPLLHRVKPDFDTRRFTDAFKDITAMIARRRPGLKGIGGIEQIPGPLLSQSFAEVVNSLFNQEFNEKFTETSYGKRLSGAVDADTGLVEFIFINTVRPFLRAFARSLDGDRFEALENSSFCPVCGCRPDMGRALKHNGQRYLHCSLCGHEWLSKRLLCPYCLNEDHHLLSTITVDDIPGCRIDACEACGSYLKVIVDETAGASGLPEMADIETVFLDIVANQKGFTNKTFY